MSVGVALRIKFFAWLLLVDRLNTKISTAKKTQHLDEGRHCVLCHEQVDETSLHLFSECTSSVTRWFAIGIQWDLQDNVCQMSIQ